MADKTAHFTDPQFLDRLRARDEEALSEVVRAYTLHLVRAGLGAGLNEEEAEETAQETFVAFVHSVERFEGRSHVRTWLFGILYNKISEARRRFRRDESHAPIDDVIESRFDTDGKWVRPPRAVDALVEDRETGESIEKCLETLPDKQRDAFLLKEVEGLETAELCNVLEITVTNLGVILYRARNRLRECLEAMGIGGN